MLAASLGAGRYSGAGTNSSAQSALMNNLAALDDPALFIPYFKTIFSNFRKGFLPALRVKLSRAPPVHLLRPHIRADGQGWAIRKSLEAFTAHGGRRRGRHAVPTTEVSHRI
jgi:hypothetical protein